VPPQLAEVECDRELEAVSLELPQYPETALQPYIGEGAITLQLTITETGAVADVKAVKPLNPFWDPRWVTVARAWRFKPCLKEGKSRVASIAVAITVRQH
jgi:outer membrane biosynthesis protein TonB